MNPKDNANRNLAIAVGGAAVLSGLFAIFGSKKPTATTSTQPGGTMGAPIMPPRIRRGGECNCGR